MIDDLHLTGNKYNVGLTVFYILYVLIDSELADPAPRDRRLDGAFEYV